MKFLPIFLFLIFSCRTTEKLIQGKWKRVYVETIDNGVNRRLEGFNNPQDIIIIRADSIDFYPPVEDHVPTKKYLLTGDTLMMVETKTIFKVVVSKDTLRLTGLNPTNNSTSVFFRLE